MRRQVQTEPPSQPSVAVAIPAYNEANGIAGFLQEIDRALSPHVSRLSLIVIDDAHAVSGVPWFRMFMPRLVRVYVHGAFGVSARDPNCPLRGYEAALLRDLLAPLPHDCLIPNLYLTLLASRRGVALLEVDVSHRV